MPEDDLDYDTSDQTTPPTDRDPNIRQLREKAKMADTVAAELAKAQRELAFARAGIDLSDTRMGYFIRGYEGALDPATIKKEAEEAGFFTSQAGVGPSGASPGEQAALERISEAGTGSPPPPAFDAVAEINAIPAPSIRSDAEWRQAVAKVLTIAEKAGVPTSRTIQ